MASTRIHCETNGVGALHEYGAAEAVLILHDPPAAAVLSDKEPGQSTRMTRQSFRLWHDPCCGVRPALEDGEPHRYEGDHLNENNNGGE
jgi:hypothetical protein